MKDRIKELRKALGLTQQSFADRLGSAQTNIANYERGRQPSAAAINNICKTFNVNETWLRTGDGDMFMKISASEEIAAFVDEILHDEPESFRRRLVTAMSRLSPDGWKKLEAVAVELLEEFRAQEPPPETPEQKAARLERENREQADRIAALEKELTVLEGGSTEAV